MPENSRGGADEVSVRLLADAPHLIKAVGEMRWQEWGKPPEPTSQRWWVQATEREAGREALPVSWVAVGRGGEALGAVGLGEYDLDEIRDHRSPWLMGTIVRDDVRGKGIGTLLVESLHRWAAAKGFPELWVGTEKAASFYERCGYAFVESISRSSGELVAILKYEPQVCR
jgi:GNAT superfamily N-acetyltransferase